jgi:hypothetical protein
MLRISFRTEPFWLDLPHGVRLLLRPPGTAVILAAGADLAARRTTVPDVDPPATAGSPADLAGDATARATDLSAGSSPDGGRLAFTCTVARAAILDWSGVADTEGESLPVSPAAIDALMEVWPVFAAFERLYVQPALLVVAEGNG